MSASRTIGIDGLIGRGLPITGRPDAALITALQAKELAGTLINHVTLVKFTWSNSLEFTLCDNGEEADGQIMVAKPHHTYTYLLTVDVWNYTDKAGNRRIAQRVFSLPKGANTINLQDPFFVSGTGSTYVGVGSCGSPGACIEAGAYRSDWATFIM